MINVQKFYDALIANDISFFAGVPDSLLKELCAYITIQCSPENHIITANEGAAIAIGTGYHLATKKVPFIYMQNSGIGNAINPLLSLADKEVYSIPMILLIGWRGEPGITDEPQHVKQGRITKEILESIEVPFEILDCNGNYIEIIQKSVKIAKELSSPVAIIVRKGTFDIYINERKRSESPELTREKALESILSFIPVDAVVVSTTGMLSRELFELRGKLNQSHSTDFLTVGSMGHTTQIALGIALAKSDKPVYCFDGDGSAIMHLGSYAITGCVAPKNLKIILFNNGAHDSVGGQPTVGQKIDFPKLAEAVNLKSFGSVKSLMEIENTIRDFIKEETVSFLEIIIGKGARDNLGRPTLNPKENKIKLQNYLCGK